MSRKRIETGVGLIGDSPDLSFDKDGRLDRATLDRLSGFLKDITRLVNGNLTVGNRTLGGRTGNFDGHYIEVTSPSGANTEFQVDHDLGRPPLGAIPLWQDKAGSVYTSNRDGWGPTRIYIKVSVATMNVGLWLI